MSFVIWTVENLFSVAETFHSGVQKVVGKADADKLIFTAEHGENTLSVGSHVDFVIGGSSVPWLLDDLNALHTVKAVGHHASFFAVVCQQIIVAVVDNQLVRAADVVFSASSGYLSRAVIQGVFQILEADFALLDSNFRVLLQGNSLRNLYIPIWQISAGWGALGRMKNNPDSIIVEISSDYNEFAKAEIVIGRKVKNLSDSDVFLVFMISPEKIKESLKNSFSFAITNRFARLLFASDSSYENQLNEIKVEYLTKYRRLSNETNTI